MSHLNEQLSALVDGELSGTELDRVNAHLAACEQCRAEAAALRLLKRELRGLAATRPSPELTRRLLAMAGPGGPVPPRRTSGSARPRPAFRTYPGRTAPGRSGPGRSDFAEWSARSRPAPHSPATWPRRKRGRYLALGALSFVLTLGIGAAALALDGSSPGTRMTPQMELFSIEHAFIGGTIPMDQGKAPGKIKPGPRHSP
ncbi:MAG TPA: zf-HC2 domain-containing protein [Trebonia sp.]|nr:zf-HC2 domain-containing protein [Trebonia sp.]